MLVTIRSPTINTPPDDSSHYPFLQFHFVSFSTQMNSIYSKPGYSVTTDKPSLLHPLPYQHSDTRIYRTEIFQPNFNPQHEDEDVNPLNPNSQHEDFNPHIPSQFTYLTLSPDTNYLTPPRPSDLMVYYDSSPQRGRYDHDDGAGENLFREIFSSSDDEEMEISFNLSKIQSYSEPNSQTHGISFDYDSEISFDLSQMNISTEYHYLTPTPTVGQHLTYSSPPDAMSTEEEATSPITPPTLPLDLHFPTTPSALPFSSLTLHSPPSTTYPSPPQPRRSERIRRLSARRTVSSEQEEELSTYFLRSRTCGPTQRRTIAKRVGMKESEVFQWFLNKRRI